MNIRLIAIAFLTIQLFVLAAFAGDTIIFGIAASSDESTKTQTHEAITAAITQSAGGTRIQVYDATNLIRLTDFEVPSARNAKGRMNRVKKHLVPVRSHLQRARSVRAGQGSELDIPGFLTVVGSTVRTRGGTTRVILIGSPYHTAAEDPSMQFGPGFYPSDLHALGSSRQTIYSVVDKGKLLDGVFVDFALAGTIGTPRELAPLRRFWGLWIEAQAGTMTSFLSTTDVVIDRALSGMTDPVVEGEFDRRESRLIMLPIDQPSPPPPPPSPAESVSEEPEPIEEPALRETIGAAIVLVVDGTSSQVEALPKIRELLLEVADIGATAGDLLQLAVVVYRERGGFDRFPLTTIERGEESEGMVSLRRFVNEKSKRVNVVDGASNESGGARTGETSMVTALEPLISFADFEGGIREGVGLLRSSDAQRKILIVAGDVGTYEADRDPQSVSRVDLESEQRARALLGDLSALEPDARLVTLFTGEGSPYLQHRERTTAFYRDLAGLFGPRGTYTTEFEDIERIVVRAILDR